MKRDGQTLIDCVVHRLASGYEGLVGRESIKPHVELTRTKRGMMTVNIAYRCLDHTMEGQTGGREESKRISSLDGG